MKTLIFTMQIFITSIAFASEICLRDNGLHLLLNDSAELVKRINLDTLKEDPTAFCNDNMMRRYLMANTNDRDSINRMSREEVAAQAQANRKKQSEIGFVTLPLESDKQKTIQSGIFFPSDPDYRIRVDRSSQPLDGLLLDAQQVINSDPCKFSSREGQDLKSLIDDPGLAPVDFTIPIKIAKTVGFHGACSEIVINDSACSRSLENMTNNMLQRGNPPIVSMPGLMNKVINSGVYDQGLKLAANLLIEKFKNPALLSSDLFSDVTDSFKKSGYSKETSEQLAFDVLGLVATGGSALRQRLNKISFAGDRWPNVTALSTIAALIPALDFYSSQKGQIYSFPPGIRGSCDTSKSYHFWMSAYLAREEVMNGAKAETSAAAAFTSNKLYHVMGNLTNRQGVFGLLRNESFSPTANIVRADLAYSSAGALFGAGADLSRPITVEEGMAASMQKSEVAPRLSESEAIEKIKVYRLFGYGDFKDRFAPNEVFKKHAQKRRYSYPNQAEIKAEIEKKAGHLPQCK